MTTEGRTQYIKRGVLRVHAESYWYSGGGEKGAFGYYPHLKDGQGRPVYPDTQIKGDLAAACHWLAALRGKGDRRKDGENEDKALIAAIFGGQGREESSPFYLTDLALTPESEKQWRERRFEVKTRIAVEDNRTVEEHMLAAFEYAFLDGLTLEADLYLAYFEDQEYLEKATTFLTDAAGLLSGFGAFRSRGYGRGRIEIDWERYPLMIVTPGEGAAKTSSSAMSPPAAATAKGAATDKASTMSPAATSATSTSTAATAAAVPLVAATAAAFFLTARCHVRNRILDPEGTQLISARRSLTAAQMRAWLVKAYRRLYGVWPTLEEMRELTVTDLHPTIGTDLSFIPPRTTVRTEREDSRDMIIKDRAKDKPQEDDDDAEDGQKENTEKMLQAKTKPLQDNYFVTAQALVLKIEPVVRFRNVMAEPGDFRTREEGGLFAQERLPKGIRFGGVIAFDPADSPFAERCRYLLAHLPPTIAGAIFACEVRPLPPPEVAGDLYLLTADIPYRPELIAKSGNSLGLTSRRGFSTANGRPRRQRLVIAAGAVLAEPLPGKTVAWKGFGSPELPLWSPPKQDKTKVAGKRPVEIPSDLKKKLREVSNAQGGQLRELMHPNLTADYLRDFLKERLAKYSQWNKKDVDKRLLPRELLEELHCRVNLEKVDMKEVRAYIRAVYEEIRRGWWNKKKNEGGERKS